MSVFVAVLFLGATGLFVFAFIRDELGQGIENDLRVMRGLLGAPTFLEDVWSPPTEEDRRTLAWLREAGELAPERADPWILDPESESRDRARTTWRREHAALLAHASRIRERPPLTSLGDPSVGVEHGSEEGAGRGTSFSLVGHLVVVEVLAQAAVDSALAGEPERSLEELSAAWRAAGLVQDPPTAGMHRARAYATGFVMRAWEHALPHLPREAAAWLLGSQIESWDPHSEMVNALYGERALGNSYFRLLSGEEDLIQPQGTTIVINSLSFQLANDWRHYLDEMRVVLRECRKRPYDWQQGVVERTAGSIDSGGESSLSQSVVPRASDLKRMVLEGEARGQLARAALRAHLDGIEAGRTLLEQQPDPFAAGGAPMQSRIEEDGTLVMWSVGENGTDEGGRWRATEDAFTDLVWRYRLEGDPPLLAEGNSRVEAVQSTPGDALLLAIDFDEDGRVGIAVGGNAELEPGALWRTEDGGESWQAVEPPTRGRLYDVELVSAELAFAVGIGGRILRSEDAGASWEIARGGPEWLAGLAIPSPERLWVAGSREAKGVLLRSEDGGRTWRYALPLPEVCQTAHLRAVAFRDERLGCVVGSEGALILTSDGGESWRAVETEGGYLRAIDFHGASTIRVVGGPGVLLESHDEGRSWRRLDFPRPSKLNSVRFADARRGWITSMEGELFETRDGGRSWELLLSYPGLHLVELIAPRDGRHGWVVGDGGTILRLRAERD